MSGKGRRFTKALIEGAGRVGEEDVRRAADQGGAVEEKLGHLPENLFERFGRRIRLFLSAVQDYASGNYRDLPWTTIAMAVFAILYFLNPADIFPDVIPLSGYLDDAGVVAAAFGLLMRDLDRYERWKRSRAGEEGET
jgi:uncharacterized membrane protein YkvA (DUF1232 family)